jgi:hypothetical protein
LTLALDGGEWSAWRSGRTLPREKDPSTHCTGGWVGLRAGLDTEVRGQILCPSRGSNPDRPVVQSVVRHCTDWATPAPDLIIRTTTTLNSRSQLDLKEHIVVFLDLENSLLQMISITTSRQSFILERCL